MKANYISLISVKSVIHIQHLLLSFVQVNTYSTVGLCNASHSIALMSNINVFYCNISLVLVQNYVKLSNVFRELWYMVLL